MKLLVVSDRSKEEDETNFLVNEFSKYSEIKVINTKIGQEKTTIIDRILHKIGIEIDKGEINFRILEETVNNKYNAILIMKGNRLTPATINKLSKITHVVGYSGDNMCRWFNRTRNYIKGLKYYKLLFVTDIPAYREIERYTQASVIYFDKRASRSLHIPKSIENCEKIFDVTFVGSYEKERAKTLYLLAKKGIAINIWGNGWKKNIYKHSNMQIHYEDVIGENYARIIRQSKIVLGFLRKANFDTQTSRSFEITACGTFALLERTAEHLRLYKEGEEIECFQTESELLTKVKKYLINSQLREEIAMRGYMRVVKDGYYFDVLAKDILNSIKSLTTS
jgi:spore maturation protein CgeB